MWVRVGGLRELKHCKFTVSESVGKTFLTCEREARPRQASVYEYRRVPVSVDECLRTCAHTHTNTHKHTRKQATSKKILADTELKCTLRSNIHVYIHTDTQTGNQ